ncbi:MAG: glycoside hydrolase family 5 protein [Fibrobacterota bacterium]|nr:MAG: glycoside hydrolase family 5 protein [Fibrobacterota bacterium]
MVESLREFVSRFRMVGMVLGLGALAVPVQAAHRSSDAVKAFNKTLGRGINLGDLLEAPYEGAWGIELDTADLSRIAAKGFRSVRIPIRWDGKGDDKDHTFERALRTSPYTVDPRFFARVDAVVEQARRAHLAIVLNDHHHDSLFRDFENEAPRFLAIWEQIAEHYRNLPTDSVAFEILNEPNGQVTSDRWNRLLDTTLRIIRSSNPTRPVVVGTANWGGPGGLGLLELPDDTNLILTVHDYAPMTFTYQGASWIDPIYPTGVTWGTTLDRRAARDGADAIASFAKDADIPVLMGEFGTTVVGDSVSRSLWAATKARLYEQRGFSWAWWDYKEPEMGLYRPGKNDWDEHLLGALFSSDTSVLSLGDPPAQEMDLIVNGQFDGSAGWHLVQIDSGKGTFRTDSGYAITSVLENPLREAWAVEICQKNMVLLPGRSYEVSLVAWADTITNIDMWVGHGAEPWDTYGTSGDFHLRTTRRSFSWGFEMAAGDSLGEVCINLGTRKAQIRVDSVKLMLSKEVGLRERPRVEPNIRQVGPHLVAEGRKPREEWLVDMRGARICQLMWRPSVNGWLADLRRAPSGRILFLEHRGIRVLRCD